MTTDQNEWFRSLNAGLPDDVARLKAAGYYREAIERIDAYLADSSIRVSYGVFNKYDDVRLLALGIKEYINKYC